MMRERERVDRRRGVTFVEILVASSILAAAFIPIAGMVNSWTKGARAEKMEAQVAAFVQLKMNQYLVEYNWDQVVSAGWTTVPLTETDGIDIQFKADVRPIITTADSLIVIEPPYHEPCSGESVFGSGFNFSTFQVDKPIPQLDLDTVGSGNEFLREIELQVRWRWPGTDPGWTDTRKIATFLTRRANLR